MNRGLYVMTILMDCGNSTHLGFWRAKTGKRAVEEWAERKIEICDVLFAKSR